MTFEMLKKKALSLPYEPGVYIMRDHTDNVIYVGKAKKLKNRVSQYFQDTASHSPKTRTMVNKIDHFDVIVAGSEFEALVLECSLIKRYMPRYNILLKDDKGYPCIRLDMKEAYPKLTMVSKPAQDGAGYYGPFGSRAVTHSLLEAIRLALRLPDCPKQFPRDIGKGRPCLNYHMGQCDGWCQAGRSQAEYRSLIEQARQLLQGNYKAVYDSIRRQMLNAADEMNFELAALLRDRLRSVENLGKKQLVTVGTLADTDVIGYGQTEAKACFTVLHFSNGNLLDKEYEVLSVPDDPDQAITSLMTQYYLSRGYAPRHLLLPKELSDTELFLQLMEHEYGKRPKTRVPQRGDNLKLIQLAQKNAYEEALRITSKTERTVGVLSLLGKMLSIEQPNRIEAYDISNISGTDMVASMVVFQDGKPKKSDYKKFKIKDMEGQDDYGSMIQVLTRRFQHYKEVDPGFDQAPDLLLIDGGDTHAAAAEGVLRSQELDFPVFGMVKDDRHRTRALVTSQGDLIDIQAQQSVFSFIGTIQEEVHRFAITYHRSLRSKRLRYSQLDTIPGIGAKRKQELLKHFGSLTAIGQADMHQLGRILPKNAAYAVYQHFHPEDKESESCE